MGMKGQQRPQDGRGKGQGTPGGKRQGRNNGPCRNGGPGFGKGEGRGGGRGRG